MRTHPEATAAVTVNEAALPGVQRTFDRAGLAIPHRFSVVGVAARCWAEPFHSQFTAPTL